MIGTLYTKTDDGGWLIQYLEQEELDKLEATGKIKGL